MLCCLQVCSSDIAHTNTASEQPGSQWYSPDKAHTHVSAPDARIGGECIEMPIFGFMSHDASQDAWLAAQWSMTLTNVSSKRPACCPAGVTDITCVGWFLGVLTFHVVA